MVRAPAWAAVIICTLGGSAVKFLVSYAYAFEDDNCDGSDPACGRRFAKPILTMLMLFLGMIVVWSVAPCWARVISGLRAVGKASAERPAKGAEAPLLAALKETPQSYSSQALSAHLAPEGKACAELDDAGSVTGSPCDPESVSSPQDRPTCAAQCCPGSWRLAGALLCFSVLDVIATLSINVSLLFVLPSVVAAIRGITPVWTLLIQRCIVPVLPATCLASLRERNDTLVRADYIGAGLTVTGVCLGALVTVIPTLSGGAVAPSTGLGPAASPGEAIVGVVLVLVGTLTQAAQFFAEQTLLDDDDAVLSPPAYVAVEGAFGATVTLLLLVAAQFLPVSPYAAAGLDGSGVLELTVGPGGTLAFIGQQPALLGVLASQAAGAFVLCLALFALPALGGGLQMRTFALVGGRGLVLVVLDLVVFQATGGRVGLAPTAWAAGDAAAVLLILAGGYCTGRAQMEREARRAEA